MPKNHTPKNKRSVAAKKTKNPTKKSRPLKAVIKPDVTTTQPKPKRLPNAFRLTKNVSKLIWQNKKLFIGIAIIYGVLNLILVQGLASSSDVNSVKSQVSHAVKGQLGDIVSGISVFAVLLSSSGNGSSQTVGAYQIILGLIVSLAIIWSLRRLSLGQAVRVKEAYYKGMSPLIPFVLVLVVIVLQLLPLLIGSIILSTVEANSIAVGFIENFLFIALFIALALVSIYFLTSSLFALYIVTLPDMTPLKALRTSRKLVKNKRFYLIRKILFLPLVLLVAAAIIMLPIIIWITFLARWVFFLLTMFALVAIHSYMYSLYRELLDAS